MYLTSTFRKLKFFINGRLKTLEYQACLYSKGPKPKQGYPSFCFETSFIYAWIDEASQLIFNPPVCFNKLTNLNKTKKHVAETCTDTLVAESFFYRFCVMWFCGPYTKILQISAKAKFYYNIILNTVPEAGISLSPLYSQ